MDGPGYLRFQWLLPSAVILIGAAVGVWASFEQGRVRHELDRAFEEHVESVARLIFEGTREATAAIDVLYALSEESLASAARLAARIESNRKPTEEALASEGVRVWLVRAEPERLVGAWGPVEQDSRRAFVREILDAEPSEIVEWGQARRHGLYCAYFRMDPETVVVCKDGKELARLRRETGLGPLLVEVARKGVVYAAIQDSSGILASSPGARLSRWDDDPHLARALEAKQPQMVFRILDDPERPLFEGIGPFPLPDGTVAVLRVGVDASHLFAVREGLDRRHRLLLVVVVALVLVSLFGTWLLRRREKRRIEAEQRLAARDQESRHWRTIGQMASTVAHEVRNPLNTLKMVAQRLGREFQVQQAERDDFHELLNTLQGEADRVNAVVSDFLDLGRPIVLEEETVPASSLLQEAAVPLRLRAEQEGKRLVVQPAGEGYLRVDRRRFEQVLSNLTSNALDAVQEGGTVRVTAEVKDGGLHLIVEDDGPGMDAETLDRIQHHFVTTRAKGTGLGLSVARRLVEAHGGRLALSSEPGRGTRAEVFLPASKERKG